MKKNLLLLSASVALTFVVACQGRSDVGPLDELDNIDEVDEVDENLNNGDGQIDLLDIEDCIDNRNCVEPGFGDQDVAELPPQHKIGDTIRGGVFDKPDVALPGPPVNGPMVQATCSDDIFRHVGQENPGIELHVISIHEAGEPGGEARVFVERSEAVALVLSSYEPTRSIVDFDVGARITEIVLNGHHDQDVLAADHIAVTKLIGEQSLGEFSTGGTDDKGRVSTARLMQAAEDVTGLPVRSFHGCESGTAFLISGQ